MSTGSLSAPAPSRARALATAALAALAAATACTPVPARAATDWMPQFERLIATSGSGAAAVAFLETLEASQRQTSDYHWALARAYRAADRPEAAAMALGVYEALKPEPRRDVKELHEWLFHHAGQYLNRATAHLHRGDTKAAVHDYLHGTMCDHAILGRQDEGLGDTSLNALDRLVHRRPERPDHWYVLGTYHYHRNHLEAAHRAFEQYRDHATDAYDQWRARIWLDRTSEDIAAQSKLVAEMLKEAEASRPAGSGAEGAAAQAASGAEDAATPAGSGAEGAAAPRATAAELAANARRIDMDARIRDLENRIRDLKELRSGKVAIAYGSIPVVTAYNQRKVKADIAAAEASLAELIAARDELR
jgi:hypothetical protein